MQVGECFQLSPDNTGTHARLLWIELSHKNAMMCVVGNWAKSVRRGRRLLELDDLTLTLCSKSADPGMKINHSSTMQNQSASGSGGLKAN